MALERKKQYATEQLTVDNTSRSLTTATVDNTANYPDFKASAVLAEATSAIYYTFDGSTPSSTNGMPLSAGVYLEISGYQNVKKFKYIRQSADGVLNVQYFKD
jgi:hypothetical protein